MRSSSADDASGKCTLACTTAEQFEQLEAVQGYAYLPVDERPAPDADWDVGVEDVVMMPSYQGADLGVYTAEIDPNVGVTYDRVPKGEVEIRRLERVESSDGHELGSVHSFVVEDGAITQSCSSTATSGGTAGRPSRSAPSRRSRRTRSGWR